MNPTIDDVVGAFERVPPTGPQEVQIDRRGVELPQGDHFEGIQTFPGPPELIVITSASDDQAYFVACTMASDGGSGRARSPVTTARAPFTHGGGCQAFGTFLVVGVEAPGEFDRRTSEVQFWDFTRFPTQNVAMTIPRSGDYQVSTAGAVGLTSFGKGVVLAVATWDADTVDFFTSDEDPFKGSPFNFKFTWVNDQADKSGWIDENFGHYQSVNLITQSDGKLFLVGFNRAGSDDFMDLFALNMDAPPPSALIKLRKKHMVCTHGCSFEAGSGIFIKSSAGFEVLAVNGDTSNPILGVGGDTIWVNRFLPVLVSGFVVSPTDLSFGLANVGEQTQRTLHLENNGAVDVVVTVPAAPVRSPFTWDALTGASIAPGSSLDLTLSFDPPDTHDFLRHDYNGTLSVESNGPGSPHVVTLRGSGRKLKNGNQ